MLSELDMMNLWAKQLAGYKSQWERLFGFGYAVEAEVRKQDEALIRQMRNAIALPCDRWNATQSRIVREAIAAADAWLEGKK